jgi:formate hydrogenlyase transcriptional activator
VQPVPTVLIPASEELSEDISSELMGCKRNETLARQLLFEALLVELSATFINLRANQVGSEIENAQRRICETLALDCSVLAQLDPGCVDAVVTHSWTAEGIEASLCLSPRELRCVTQKLKGAPGVRFAEIDDPPGAAVKDTETWVGDGLEFKVTFPLSVGRETVGVLAFGSKRGQRAWLATLVDRLGLVAQVFASALARARSDKALHQAYREIKHLKSRLEKENSYLREEIALEHQYHLVIGKSADIRRVLQKAEQVAATDANVLLFGETGTGKELIARCIHEASRRKDRAMVKVNCATLPAALVESELFGRERGAYTGALTREIGRFELANGSTILLDEIGELPLELQAKLLRVLQEGEFERLGSPRTIKVDVRGIAATSRNLQEAIRERKFREDLFYRLNVFPIVIPPRRERREDIPALVWHFVNDLSQRMGRSIETIHGPTMEALKSYSWPGNIRELRNVIERFLIRSKDTVFRAEVPAAEKAAAVPHPQTAQDAERIHILNIMELVAWRVRGEGGAAQVLNLRPTTLESRMQRLRIVRPR